MQILMINYIKLEVTTCIYIIIVDSDVECSTSCYDEDDHDDLISSNVSPDNISTTSDSSLI